MICRLSIPTLLFLTGIFSRTCMRTDDFSDQASRILEGSGVTGGLVVHYQCGDGRLTAALRQDGRYTVHGLDRDRDEIGAARDFIASSVLPGDVSVMHWDSPGLPYTDRLVNLFFSEGEVDMPAEEVIRVLVPGGVAFIDGKKTVKPWPAGIDEWNQARYDHTNNGVSSDTVGLPRYLRWTCGPRHARSHEENSSTMAAVTAGGRMFYIQDEGLIGISDGRLPDNWKLIARDAFNGKLLWKLPVPEWGWQVWEQQNKDKIWTMHMAQRHQFPSGMARRLVARDNRVYMTLGYRAPVSVIDAATGKIIRTLEQTSGTDEILLVDKILLALQREVPARDRNREVPLEDNPSRILAIDPEKGKLLWSLNSGYVWQWSMVSDGERVFYFDADMQTLRAVDLDSGRRIWETRCALEEIESSQYIGMTFLVHEAVLVYMGPGRIEAFDARTGKSLWNKPGMRARAPVSHNQPSMFVADGMLWLGGPRISGEGEVVAGYDPGTGREVRTIDAGYLVNTGHHYRCYMPRATENYLIFPRRGAEFVDLKGDNHLRNDWLRGACRFGSLPCNGLFYVSPHQCFCYRGVLIDGFNALASGLEERPGSALPVRPRLIRGPAYEQALAAKKNNSPVEPWPVYRHDNARSGASEAEIDTPLSLMWEASPGGKLTQPVVAQGCLYVSDRISNSIFCLDGESGEELWRFIADAEVDSPPSFHQGMLYFGCTDGWVYCVDAGSGLLAWRHRVAPQERLIMDESRLQSAWPVHGSVVVLNGIVYAAAGRSSFTDGGIYLSGIDAYNGQEIHHGHFEGPYPDMDRRTDYGQYMEGALNDLLVTDGEFMYLRQNKFDLALNHIPVEPLTRMGDCNVGLHLFATGGMLDDSFWNRNFWMYSKRWPGFYIANQAPKTGQLVTFDSQNTYAVKHYTRRNPHSPMIIPGKDGYLVFADRNDTPLNLYNGTEEKKPIAWLPAPVHSTLIDRRIAAQPDDPAVNRDKGAGFTRTVPPLWMEWHPTRFKAMSQAGDRLLLWGVPDEIPEEDPMAAFEGRLGSRLVIVDKYSGETVGVLSMEDKPLFDGISIGKRNIYLATGTGKILCLGQKQDP